MAAGFGQVIIDFQNGFAGKVVSMPNMLVGTEFNGSNVSIPFGTILMHKNGIVQAADGTLTMANLLGMAAAAVETNLGVYYPYVAGASYAPNDAMAVLTYGVGCVVVNAGVAARWGSVYVRITANSAVPTGVVGGIEAAPPDPSNCLLLTNVRFVGAKDASGIAGISLLVGANS